MILHFLFNLFSLRHNGVIYIIIILGCTSTCAMNVDIQYRALSCCALILYLLCSLYTLLIDCKFEDVVRGCEIHISEIVSESKEGTKSKYNKTALYIECR